MSAKRGSNPFFPGGDKTDPQVVVLAVADAPRLELGGRGHSLGLLNDGNGVGGFAMHVNVLDPGPPGPYHLHEHSENAFLILEGEAQITIDGREHRVPKDHVVFIPPGVPHRVGSYGDHPVRLLEIYVPAAFDDFLVVELETSSDH